jgi:glycosyltransferase involved in cell wall biosynthesis
MRIAVWHNLPNGGGKRALYYHVRGLVDRGHVVEAWCPPSVDQNYLPLGDIIPEHVVPMRHPRPDIVRGHVALGKHSRACAEQINDSPFDLLLAHPCQYLFAPPIGHYIKIPSVLYLQEPRRVLYEASPELPWLALPASGNGWWWPPNMKARLRDAVRIRGVRRDGRYELENARAYETILVNSLFSRESVLRAYGIDARVCYLGVDTDLFAPQGKEREDLVIGLGSIAPAKNITFIIEALARLPQPRPRLVWIGYLADAAYAEHVTLLAHSLSVPFELKMRVTDDELVDLLNRARLMACAPRLEPFGYAPLEANACGLPVVGVAEGGLRETVIDGVTGLVVEHDPEAMAQAIRRLTSDAAYAAQLGDNGRRIVLDRWSLPASIDRLEQRLRDVLASRSRDNEAGARDGDGEHESNIDQSTRVRAGQSGGRL